MLQDQPKNEPVPSKSITPQPSEDLSGDEGPQPNEEKLDLFRDADKIPDGSIMRVIDRKTGEILGEAVIRRPKKP